MAGFSPIQPYQSPWADPYRSTTSSTPRWQARRPIQPHVAQPSTSATPRKHVPTDDQVSFDHFRARWWPGKLS